MWEYQNTDELYHHGVLGMRWGHRKTRVSSSTGRRKKSGSYKKSKIQSKDSRRANYIKKKSVSQMSNKELKDVNNRLQLEKQYNDLTKKKNIGKKAVTAFVATAGTIAAVQGAYNTYKTVGTKAVKAIGSRVIK